MKYEVRMLKLLLFLQAVNASILRNTQRVSARNDAALDSSKIVVLTQSDFEVGTYRIQQSGKYVLEEDIEFEPQKANDYWPPPSLYSQYPPAQYYLGFFAAITVESDDVEIDLQGHTIQMSKEFYLLQRFFNVIELNDRVFTENQGVSSLNYQKTDQPLAGPAAGGIVTPKHIRVHNGTLGRSSHSGIHGNYVQYVELTNLIISGFEVSGIHCNGCMNVEIESCTVGPSSQAVPALATYSNSRFLEFFTSRLIPMGFQREPVNLMTLFNETIEFADRPGQIFSLQEVFDRNLRANHLYRDYYNQVDQSALNLDDLALLEEAMRIFSNPSGLADGAVQYGIFFNEGGTPPVHDNFYGPKVRNITLRNVRIQGLHSNPIQVPSLQTEEGVNMQGVARDLLRIADLTTDNMRTLVSSYYKGNFLSDVYFALWKMSNLFFRARVFDSDCGNFASNASMPYNLQGMPNEFEPTCADLGTKVDSSLSGDAVAMLQKRYFGGLQMSQGVYDWGTSHMMGLHSLLETPTRADLFRNGGHHKVVCGHDTMFHPNHGIVGLKIVETANVVAQNVEVVDFLNSAEYQPWICQHSWQIPGTGETVSASTNDPVGGQGSIVRGVEIDRSANVVFEQLQIHRLRSTNGAVIGMDVVGDGGSSISFSGSSIESLFSPIQVAPYRSTEAYLISPAGLSMGPRTRGEDWLVNPQWIITLELFNARIFRGSSNPLTDLFLDKNVLDELLVSSKFKSVGEVAAHRLRVLAYFEERFGMSFDESAYNVTVGNFHDKIIVFDTSGRPTDSVIKVGYFSSNLALHSSSLCYKDLDGLQKCAEDFRVPVFYFSYNFHPGKSGYKLSGAFGQDSGHYCPENHIISVGFFCFENIPWPEATGNNKIQIDFFAENPTPISALWDGTLSFSFDHALDSDVFGTGRSSGALIVSPRSDRTDWVVNGHPILTFDGKSSSSGKNGKDLLMLDNNVTGLSNTDSHPDYYFFVADGKLNFLLGGVDALPYGYPCHYNDDAAIQFFKTRTSLKTNAAILEFRASFLRRLKDFFGISVEPGAFGDITANDEIRLGGGTVVKPYVTNDDINQRIMTKRQRGEGGTIPMPATSRLQEGGFLLVAGRSGVMTKDGRLPFGTMIMQGKYNLKDSTGDHLEIDFHSLAPTRLDAWSASIVYQSLSNDQLGEGRLYATVLRPRIKDDGMVVSINGVLVFG